MPFSTKLPFTSTTEKPSSLHSASTITTSITASPSLESAFLKTSKRIHTARFILALLSFTSGIVIMGTSAHALDIYDRTHLSNQWFLPLWPQHFDLRPTKALIGVGTVIATFNLIVMVVSIVPMPKSRTSLLNILSLPLSSLSLVAAITGTAFTSYIATHPRLIGGIQQTDTLESWTCHWSHSKRANEAGVPASFAMICTESEAAFGIVAGLVGLEALALGLGVWGVIVQRRIKAVRAKGFGEM